MNSGVREQVQADEPEHRQPYPDVLQRQQHQYAHRQEDPADQGDHEAGEEVRKDLHVAVYPLDELAWGGGVVKRHVQPDDVQRHVGPEPVGRPPRHVHAHVVGRRNGRLSDKADDEQENARLIQASQRALLEGRVDEVSEDLGKQQLQAMAADKQNGQQKHPGPVRPEVPTEKLYVLRDLSKHCYATRGESLRVASPRPDLSETKRASRVGEALDAPALSVRSAYGLPNACHTWPVAMSL